MDPDKITNASLLDIVFEGRNKAYGAYELRTNYNKRMVEAMIAVALLTALLFAANTLTKGDDTQKQVLYVKDVQLTEIQKVERNEPPPPPPPPPPKTEMQKVETTKFTPPRIVKDNEVKEDEKPPEQDKLLDTKIGAINQEGVKDAGIVAPPGVEGGKGIVEAPKQTFTEDYEKTFVKVEIESEYPGGAAAWLRYLNKNFRYPEDAINNEIQGTIVVQFIVDKEGVVSDVEAISGPGQGGLREEAVRVIRKSGLWTPAIQNGRKVRSYKKQPVIFKMMTQ